MVISILSYFVGMRGKADGTEQDIEALSPDFARRSDAEIILKSLSGRYPVARVWESERSYDLTNPAQLREYRSHIAHLYSAIAEDGEAS